MFFDHMIAKVWPESVGRSYPNRLSPNRESKGNREEKQGCVGVDFVRRAGSATGQVAPNGAIENSRL
jgi:hypothetical protein